MSEHLSLQTIEQLLTSINEAPTALKELAEGSNHYVFEAVTQTGKAWIVKFPRIRHTEKKYQQGNRDTLFNGELSLEREAWLLN
ncbi:MAG: hypothetical protein IH607_09065, partial [Firmicutes bacterium]|nr:hypothetical protein [Bacillota bacterium]